MTTLSEQPLAEKSIYKGSCHCGFATYTVGLDLTTPTAQMRGAIFTRCNCTICHKSGALLADPGPDIQSSFTLLTPSSDTQLREYTFNTRRLRWFSCPQCGIQLFVRGKVEIGGAEVEVMRINILTLDAEADGAELEDLRKIKIMYWDTRDNDPSTATLADQPCKGGIWSCRLTVMIQAGLHGDYGEA
ncbi:hypothetical protein QBC35DRAFT_180779 [Podospora australis]|uniref:CENP-V/GFA domain-containing protein n=1 Tax=Podospora australis TaxID=1536484 RepID=A0AAN7AIZ2_9PEZI|nr:hypothetical protein QBC35DRAFT_180779 [Podospora australis]